MPTDRPKLYCYVDETGQDPRSEVFVVVVVAVGEEREVIRQALKEIEFASRKADKKWTKATETQQAAYCAAVSQVSALRHKIFFARYPKPVSYLDATVQAVRAALHAAGNQQAISAGHVVFGRHLIALGIEPGPHMGLLLKTLYERQLDGEITSTDDGLVAARLLVDHASGPDA